jgi:hypothetical protein
MRVTLAINSSGITSAPRSAGGPARGWAAAAAASAAGTARQCTERRARVCHLAAGWGLKSKRLMDPRRVAGRQTYRRAGAEVAEREGQLRACDGGGGGGGGRTGPGLLRGGCATETPQHLWHTQAASVRRLPGVGTTALCTMAWMIAGE